MKCGDVYGFYTRQAPNHRGKHKLHLYLCLTSTEPAEHVFMFISSTGVTDHCMSISVEDWPQMTKNQSVISFPELYQYSKSELSGAKLRGRLSDDALRRLMDHAEDSETMTGENIDIVIDALRAYFGSINTA
jgi:hypothetical protein